MQWPYIAIVDDDEGMCRALQRLLKSYRFDVTVHHHGFEFLAAIEERKPDCAVIDIELPDFNGLELYHQLRRSHPHLPVIVITAWEDEQLKAKALSAGVQAFFYKPFSDEGLIKELEYANRYRRARYEGDA